MKRQELLIKMDSEKGLGFDEARKNIAEKFSKPCETIEVCKVKGSFGKQVFEVHANIYYSSENLSKALEMKKTQKQRKAEVKIIEDAAKTAEEEKKKTTEAKAAEAQAE